MAYQNPCFSCASKEEQYPYCLKTCKSFLEFQKYWMGTKIPQQFIYQNRVIARTIGEAIEKIRKRYKNITELRIWLANVQPYEDLWFEYSVTCDGKKVAE